MDTALAPHEEYLCYCEWLTRDEVIAAIPLARDIHDLMARTGVNTLCYGCADDLDDLVTEHSQLFGSARTAA
jgi:bacterioferritin-associated ferredoxin